MAVGLGLDTKIGVTTVNMDIIKDNYYIGAGGGFLLDTAVANNKLFNYRLGLTYTYQFHNATLSQFKLNNIFGFGVIRNKRLRFWLGPKIDIGHIVGSMENWENSLVIVTGQTI